jgi:hypothetical protein
MSKQRKIGAVPPNRIPVIDRHGFVRGHVGERASAPTAARFTNNPAMKLGEHNGRTSWIEQSTSARAPQPRRAETANHKSARGSVRAK